MSYIAFLKSQFGLRGKRVEWGLIEEIVRPVTVDAEGRAVRTGNTNVTFKPGLYIHRSRLCLDIFARRFYSLYDYEDMARHIYRARWQALPDGYVVLEARDFPDKHLLLNRYFVEDTFNGTVYDKSMEELLFL